MQYDRAAPNGVPLSVEMKEFINESVPVFSGLYQISYVARRYAFEVDIIYFPYF